MAHATHLDRPREIKSLTGLRGVRSMPRDGVPLPSRSNAPGVARLFLLRGYLAVDLFFVLSGFMMALTYQRRFSSGFRSREYFHFLYLRLARVYPLYIVVTGAFLALGEPAISAGRFFERGDHRECAFGSGLGLGPEYRGRNLVDQYRIRRLSLVSDLVVHRRWRAPTLARLSVIGAFVILCVVATRTSVELQQPIRTGALDVVGSATVYPLLRVPGRIRSWAGDV